jgi:RNA polymerase sigma factor (sigma-70 family)
MNQARGSAWTRLAFSRGAASTPATDGDALRSRDLLLPHLDSAYGYARYLVRDDAAAEDIVQEAFLRALRAIDQCRGNPRAWLLAIVRNSFHDWVQVNRRYVAIDDDGPIDQQAEADAGEALDRSAAAGGVRRLVESLPEPFRATLVLRELEELSYREIADVTAAPIGTVMSRLARARQMLAAMLKPGEQAAGDDADEAAAR